MFPADLQYTGTHEWLRIAAKVARVGITDHAAELLGDVVYVSLPEVGDEVRQADAIVELESTKSVEDAFAPLSGEIVAVNPRLADNPGLINEDAYGEGWLFEIQFSDPAEIDTLLDADEYEDLVDKEEE
ncbi:MAG: glycine cleavage system protein GcvH [Propionibacteriaceae bacterium]|jgi:glycine cleavage system H protein|nr:glycine cleavage system protein GcvH [Propionibacteriaceae bacterium]